MTTLLITWESREYRLNLPVSKMGHLISGYEGSVSYFMPNFRTFFRILDAIMWLNKNTSISYILLVSILTPPFWRLRRGKISNLLGFEFSGWHLCLVHAIPLTFYDKNTRSTYQSIKIPMGM